MMSTSRTSPPGSQPKSSTAIATDFTTSSSSLIATCRDLLQEARELGLNLDDVIDAMRRAKTAPQNSN